MPVAPARHAGPLALTLGVSTRYCVGALCVRLGACLVVARLVGVFACGWLGFVFTRGACSFGCLRACLCALAWGWWGSVVPPPPCPGLLACVLTLWCGLVGVCAVLRARWADGGQVGAGQSCPAPLRALVALSTARCVARKERGVGGEGALMVC